METDFPVLMPALRRVEHLRGVRLLNAKLPGASADETDGSRFEPVDTFVKIRFHTKQTGHGAFRSSDFEFITAPEYRTIYPSWHLNLASSFPTAQTIWTALFQIDVLARKSVKDEDSFETNYAGQARGILAESALNSASNRATPSSLLHDANNTEGVQSIVQVNPHTEAADEEFVNEEGLSHLVDPSTEVDMSKLIFLPSPKWPEIVQHAQTNTLLFLLDDGGGRERWYCFRDFGLHLYKKGVLGRVDMQHPNYNMQHEETLDFASAQRNAFQAFLACLSCQSEIAAVDAMRDKATAIIESAKPTISDVSHYRQQLKDLDMEFELQNLQLRQEQKALRNATRSYETLMKLTKEAAQSLREINETLSKRVKQKREKLSRMPSNGSGGGSPRDTQLVATNNDRALRQKLSVSQHLLYARKLRLVAQLRQIYPINRTEAGSETLSINGVELPDSNLRDYNKGGEECICAALGYVGHLVMMLGKYLETSLFFPIKTAGSRSTIRTSRREYPLYRKGINDPSDFVSAVKLLKRDIYQLLLAAGIQPPFGRHVNADGAGILANLSFLMKRIFK